MDKIFLILFLMMFQASFCFGAEKVYDDGNVDIYYIRARDYAKPSPNTRTEAGKALINIINNAEKTIDFAFYGLSGQDEILNALLNAQKRGVKIRGIVDIDVTGRNDYAGTLENISKFKKGTVKSDYKSDIEKLKKIQTGKIATSKKFNGHIMHNKFCIVDNYIV